MDKTSAPSALPSRNVVAGLTACFIGVSFITAGCSKSEESVPYQPPNPVTADVVNERIEFKLGGNSEPYRTSGWSKTEPEFTWSKGTSAKISLPISASPAGLTLKIVMAALIQEPDLPLQPVEVYANGQKIVEWQVGNTAEFAAAIPGEITKNGGTLEIEFRTPKAASPKALGISADPRVLGICVRTVELAGPDAP